MEQQKFDLIIYGASGYSGKRTLKVLIEILDKENLNLKWAIAGRSVDKLRKALTEVEAKMLNTQRTQINVPIIKADSSDRSALIKMTSQSKLIVNCAGPYKESGFTIIEACIKSRCNYIDISAEANFFDEVERRYSQEAKNQNTYIVLACGFYNIIPEIGVKYLRDNFKGTLNSVDIYLLGRQNMQECSMAYSTETSWATYISEWSQPKIIQRIPEMKPKLKKRNLPHKPIGENFWAILNRCSILEDLDRTQRYFCEICKVRPIQISSYLAQDNFIYTLLSYILSQLWFFLAQFKTTSNLMLKYPKLFHFGLFTSNHAELKTEHLELTTILKGRGWRNIDKVDCNFERAEDCSCDARIVGFDAYELTGVCVVSAALTVLNGEEKLPKAGGVYTPGVFFEHADISNLLQKYGLKFEFRG